MPGIFGRRVTEEEINRIGEKVVLRGADPEEIAELLVTIVVPPLPPPFSTLQERIGNIRARRRALQLLGDIAVSLGVRVPWRR